MTESMKYYESIRRKYPEAVSKDQFYQIAHISKATALHLLQNGLVPCKDTGKKTRRYTIRTDDIIFYLIDRELHPEVYRAPDRWYQERSGHYNSRVTYRNELTKLSEEERANFRKYMEDEFYQYGDLLTVVEVAEAIGYCDTHSRFATHAVAQEGMLGLIPSEKEKRTRKKSQQPGFCMLDAAAAPLPPPCIGHSPPAPRPSTRGRGTGSPPACRRGG